MKLGSMDDVDELMLDKMPEKDLGTSGMIEIFNSDSNQTEYIKVYLDGESIKCKVLEGSDSKAECFVAEEKVVEPIFFIGSKWIYYGAIVTIIPERSILSDEDIWINNPAKGYEHWVAKSNLVPIPKGTNF